MAKKNSFVEYVVHDMMGHIPGITSRAMFGGYGLYLDGKIFAVIADDEVYLKTADEAIGAFELYGSHPFTYEAKGKKMQMKYWLLPQEIADDPEQLRDWVVRAVNTH